MYAGNMKRQIRGAGLPFACISLFVIISIDSPLYVVILLCFYSKCKSTEYHREVSVTSYLDFLFWGGGGVGRLFVETIL
jgi:hypothetical protein